MIDSLSVQEARKLVLLSQRVLGAKQGGPATAATLSAIEHLGYIQIDAISVIQRAHHHTLWNRNPRYKGDQLDQLIGDKQVFEYWSHAAAYLPMRDYRYSLPRKEGLAKGEQNHWYERDERMMKSVLKRITTEGPLMAKDFVHTGKRIGEWKTKPAKRALEYLFMQGDLMAPKRVNFHKVYDLTERVLPAGTDTTRPDPETYARFLITRYLRANGLGQPSEVAYLQNHTKQLISKTMEDMVSSGELLKIHVTDNLYYAFPPALELLSNPLARSKLKLLSPFDNLVIQRKRMKALFGFDYQIECYVPEAKRQYGYFSLPILWDGKLVGRMDCRTERNEALLHIHHLSMDSSALKRDVFFLALRKELKAFLKFNNCNQIRIHRTTPSMIKPELQAVLDDISK
tara:strand:- start:1002 stop:2201 length:1200 start_codon:yes stop_codon:yes gene_type:complete